MSKKSEIKKIVVEVNGEELVLTLDAAKELHKILDELFDKKTEVIIRDKPTYVYPPYYYTYIQAPQPQWIHWTVTYDPRYSNVNGTSYQVGANIENNSSNMLVGDLANTISIALKD